MTQTHSTAQASSARQRVHRQIEVLNLQSNVLDLTTTGFTVLPGILSNATIEQAKQAILQRVEKKTGKFIDSASATRDDFAGMTYLAYLLYDDPVFEEILLAEKPLALMTYLLGESCLLSSLGCHFKGPGSEGELPLHSDNGNGMPSPYPSYAQVANINYALTPYSPANGALALVPGSHHWARAPRAGETALTGADANPAAVAMDIEPGDAVVWHGNTWHGSYPRTAPGIRMNIAVYMCRQYVQTQESHVGDIPDAVARRQANDERFNVLLGAKQPYGWREEGPDYDVMARNPRGLYD